MRIEHLGIVVQPEAVAAGLHLVESADQPDVLGIAPIAERRPAATGSWSRAASSRRSPDSERRRRRSPGRASNRRLGESAEVARGARTSGCRRPAQRSEGRLQAWPTRTTRACPGSSFGGPAGICTAPSVCWRSFVPDVDVLVRNELDPEAGGGDGFVRMAASAPRSSSPGRTAVCGSVRIRSARLPVCSFGRFAQSACLGRSVHTRISVAPCASIECGNRTSASTIHRELTISPAVPGSRPAPSASGAIPRSPAASASEPLDVFLPLLWSARARSRHRSLA